MRKKNREINIFSMSALDLFASAMGAFLLIAVMALPYYLKVDPDLIDQVKQLKTEISENNLKIATLEEELKKCREDGVEALRQAQAKIEALEQANKQLQQELDSTNKQLKQCESQRESLQEENEQLEQENEQLQRQAQKMQKELSQTFCVVNIKWDSQKKQDVDLHVTDPNGRRYYFSQQTFAGSSASLTVDSKNVMKGAEVWIDKELMPGKYVIEYVYYSGTGPVLVKGSVLTKSFTQNLPDKRLITPNNEYRQKIAEIIVDRNGQATLQTN